MEGVVHVCTSDQLSFEKVELVCLVYEGTHRHANNECCQTGNMPYKTKGKHKASNKKKCSNRMICEMFASMNRERRKTGSIVTSNSVKHMKRSYYKALFGCVST